LGDTCGRFSCPRTIQRLAHLALCFDRSTMQSRLSICLAIALVFSAQVDDAWVIAPFVPLANPAVDDDDEYLTAEQQQDHLRQCSCQEPSLGNLNARVGDSLSPCLERGMASWEKLSQLFGPSFLYLFMSLQR
jgi:hypothetical protein